MSDIFNTPEERKVFEAEDHAFEVSLWANALNHCESYQNKEPMAADLKALAEPPCCFRGCKAADPMALRPVAVTAAGWRVLKALNNPSFDRAVPLSLDTLEPDDLVHAACWSCGPHCADKIKARSAESVVLKIACKGAERATEGFVITRETKENGRVLVPVRATWRDGDSAHVFRRDLLRFDARGYLREKTDAAWVRRTTALELVLLDVAGFKPEVTVQRGGPFHWWQRVAEGSLACAVLGFPTAEDTNPLLPHPKVRIFPSDAPNVVGYIADSFALSIDESEPRFHFTIRGGTILWQTYLTAGVAVAMLECPNPVDMDPRKLAQRAVSWAEDNNLRVSLYSRFLSIRIRLDRIKKQLLGADNAAYLSFIEQWETRLKPFHARFLARDSADAIQAVLEPLWDEFEGLMELDWGVKRLPQDTPGFEARRSAVLEARRSVVAQDAPREFRILVEGENGIPVPFVPDAAGFSTTTH
jgi:hypothetical protein